MIAVKSRPRCWIASVTVVLVFGLGGSTAAWAANVNPQVFPIGSKPYGLTYGQWSERWWQFAVQQTTLDFCAPTRPASPVAFLTGTGNFGSIVPVTTFCTVPSGQALMFPLFNVEWSQAEANNTPGSCPVSAQPSGTSEAALLACASAQADHALLPGGSLTADIDGRTLGDLTSYRAVSPSLFEITPVTGNPFGIPVGNPPTTQALADGFWIILAPLATGTHTIHFTATVPFPEFGGTFFVDQTDVVTVQRWGRSRSIPSARGDDDSAE